MLLDEKKAREVFKKIKHIREEINAYCLAPDRHDLPVEDFQRIVGQMYGVKIEKFEVPYEGTFLRGMMLRYKDRVVIYVKKNMEKDWQKFAAVKELCHVVIDEPEDWSVDGVATVTNLLAEYRLHQDRLAAKVVQSETFAEIAAIELLYPFKERVTDRDNVNGGAMSTAQLASTYGIPEVFIAQALADWYHDMAAQIWGEVGLD